MWKVYFFLYKYILEIEKWKKKNMLTCSFFLLMPLEICTYCGQFEKKCIFLCPRDRRSGGGGYCFCPVCHSLCNFNFANNFWTVGARALIFHMSNPCDKTFSWVPLFFTLWPWPWSLTHFLKTLTLLITFE